MRISLKRSEWRVVYMRISATLPGEVSAHYENFFIGSPKKSQR
jgi:hypothetical protein